MEKITQSTEYEYLFKLVNADDDESAETGKAPTVQIRKAGGSFGPTTNPASEIANGWYKVIFTTTEANTLGPMLIEAWATGTNVWSDKVVVEAAVGAVAVNLDTTQLNKIADTIIRRAMSSVEASATGDTPSQYSLLGAVLKIIGRVEIDGINEQMVVYETDETTEFFRQDITTDPGAEPIVGVY